MYPTNQYMDPYYSHFRNHAPYPYYPPPIWEAGQPRMMDSSYRPPSYGPWPYNSGMHHPHPSEFHCCCHHSYPPGHYGFRPPFPQELPAPHLYYHGPFPQHPNEFPSYFARPHPYPVEQTPYDYDKFKSHCCGCPNHVCHGGEKSNVKIEEERPDRKPERELKGADDSSIIRYPKNQYPIVWLPSGNLEDKENGKRYELPPQLLNGWVPVDGKRSEDAKQQGQLDQKEQQYQWPIIWMPAGYDETKQKAKELKEKDENPKVTEGTPSSPMVKIIPLSWFEDQKPAAKSDSRDHSDRSAVKNQPEHQDGAAMEGHHETTPVVSRKVNDETKPHHETTSVVPRRVNDETKPIRENYRTIPVLPEKETGEKKVGTYRTIPVMTQKENDEKKPAVTEKKVEKKAGSAEKQGENGKGSHSESPRAKHSKLPPVCLRLDPLPRKKSGNGSSRSPSPPTRMDADKVKKDMSETQSQNLEPKESDTKKHTVVSERKEKSPEGLKEGGGFSNETVRSASAKHSPEEVPRSKDNQKVQTSGTSVQAQENADSNTEGVVTQENAGAETLKGGDKSPDRNSETFRANLSESDAAVHIQSAYKGYDVRRWQPLDKLRKIRDVHEQMQGVRKQLQSLEASCKKPTEKEQVAIGEAIMNLLLKLDTIQGLHPCVREARKSVARELICLQEKLDLLCKQPSGGFDSTNEDERLDRAECVVHTAAPTLTAEEEKAVGSSEVNETSSVNSMELCDTIPSEVYLELEQDADPSELNNQNNKPCTSRIEVPYEQGKIDEKVEFQGTSSAHIMNAVSLPEHPYDNHERQIEESNAGSQAKEEEKKVAVADEGQEMPLMDCMGPSHDAALTKDSSGQEKCMASNVQLHSEEPNSGVSPAVTGDTKASTESLDKGLAVDNDGSDQTREGVDVGTLELKHDVSSAEETPDVILEDPTTAADSVLFNAHEEPEEASNMNVQDQVADSMQDFFSTKEADGTPEASIDGIEPVASEEPAQATQDSTKESDGAPEASIDDIEPAASEEPAQATQDSTKEPDGTTVASIDDIEPSASEGVEPTLEFDSVPEQNVLEESNNTMQSELCGKDDVPHVDQKSEVLELGGGELDVQEKNNSLAEGADPGAETVLPELDSSGSSCTHEEVITGYERPDMKATLDSQTANQNEGSCADAEAPKTEECAEMPKEAPAGVMEANPVEEVDTRVSETGECNGTPNDSTICATGATSAEVEAHETKEDVSVQAESKASEEASVTHGVKDNDEKKLAEENQKLKALLQKLLASGNDQMEVITDLSEKVKVLERKLARKKKPKVRVHRSTRHATAKVH